MLPISTIFRRQVIPRANPLFWQTINVTNTSPGASCSSGAKKSKKSNPPLPIKEIIQLSQQEEDKVTPRRSLKWSEKVKLAQFEHLKDIDPDLCQFMLNTQVLKFDKNGKSKKSLTVFDQIQTYTSGYAEKAILVDPETALSIANCVLRYSERDKDTVFFDGEAGSCSLAKNILESGEYKEVKILEKDMHFQVLHEYANTNYLHRFKQNYEILDINLIKVSSDSLSYGGDNYVSLLKHEMPERDWSDRAPNVTLLATATQGLVKYLTERCLRRDNPLSEFHAGRPEFFLIVTARTYLHMTCGAADFQLPDENPDFSDDLSVGPRLKKLMLPYNVLFQILFKQRLVQVLPRRSFFPWKSYKPFYRTARLTDKKTTEAVYQANHDNLMLVQIRPRTNFPIKHCTPSQLQYFLVTILKNKSRNVVTLFEKWFPDSRCGADVVLAGYDIFTEVGELDVPDLINLLNLICSREDFGTSNFVDEAEIHDNYRNTENFQLGRTEWNELAVKVMKELKENGPESVRSVYEQTQLGKWDL